MTHAAHEALPGYDASQLLHDRCPECEQRGAAVFGVMYLDSDRIRHAWERSYLWNGKEDGGLHLSHAEVPLLQQIWAMQLLLERHCGWPIGFFPPANMGTLSTSLNLKGPEHEPDSASDVPTTR